MAVKKLTGKASYITYRGQRLSITKYTPDVERTMADVMGSDNYQADQGVLAPQQIATKVAMKLSVEGNFDLNQTNALIIADLYSDIDAAPVVLGLDAGTIFGHGNFDISKFSTDVAIEDKVPFTCELMQNGKFTPGA